MTRRNRLMGGMVMADGTFGASASPASDPRPYVRCECPGCDRCAGRPCRDTAASQESDGAAWTFGSTDDGRDLFGCLGCVVYGRARWLA